MLVYSAIRCATPISGYSDVGRETLTSMNRLAHPLDMALSALDYVDHIGTRARQIVADLERFPIIYN